MKNLFDLRWLSDCSNETFEEVLLEYRYFAHRFVPWVALILAKTKEQKIRQLLLPNLVEECGTTDTDAHLYYLDNMLRSIGIANPEKHKPSASTMAIEQWFYDKYDAGNTYESLCIMGPATEAVSHLFLEPLLLSIKKRYQEKQLDLTYFEVHMSEEEDIHAECINDALSILENQNKELKKQRAVFIRSGISKHLELWNNLKLCTYIQ